MPTGGTWTTVGTYALNTAAYATNVIAVPVSAGANRCWRLLANANPSTGPWTVSEVAFYTAGGGANLAMTLQSATLPSGVSSPSTGRVFAQIDPSSDAFTPGTDLIASLSRDGGVTFTAGTLALVETQTDGTKLYDTGAFAISAQPAGSTMTAKFVTANAKSIAITGYGIQVRP